MLSKVIFAFLAVTLLTLTGKVHCKYNKIDYFLTNYEVSNITEVERRSTLKIFGIIGAEKSFQITAFGNTSIIDLTFFFPREDSEVTFISKLRNTSGSFLASDYVLHYGSVRDVDNSLVLGYFGGPNNLFRGYVITDEVYCVEPYGSSDSVIIYRFKDVIFPGCSKGPENEDLDCSETRFFTPWKANKPPRKRTSVFRYSLFYDTYLELYSRLMSNQTRRKENGEMNDFDQLGKNKTDRDEGKYGHKKHNAGVVDKHAESNKTKSNTHKSSDSSEKENRAEKNKQNRKTDRKEEIAGKDNEPIGRTKDVAYYLRHGKKVKDSVDSTTEYSRKNEADDSDEEDSGGNKHVESNKTKSKARHQKSKSRDSSEKDIRVEKNKHNRKTDHKEESAGKDSEPIGRTKDIAYYLRHGKKVNDSVDSTTEYSRKNEADDSDEKDSSGKKKKPDHRHEDNETDHDDDDDDGDDTHEKDDDRFSIDNYERYRVLSDDFDQSLNSFASKSGIDEAVNILKRFYNDQGRLDMWKEPDHEESENLKYEPVNTNEKEENMNSPVAEALKGKGKEKGPEGRQCNVQVVLGPSITRKFGGSDEMAIKDVLTQFSLVNRILRKVPFAKGGKAFRLVLHVDDIVVHGDQVYSPFTEDGDLEYFTKVHRSDKPFCLVVGLVNRYLRSGELFDGYVPEGGGGACAKSGNVVIVSHGNENTPAPMGLYFAALLRALTRALGASDRDSQCTEGTFPNPMRDLQDHILAKEISPKTENSIFTTCNVKDMEDLLKTRACFAKVPQPLCGDAILDPGEECDCGPGYVCSKVDPCCHALHTGRDGRGDPSKAPCTLVPDAQCSMLQQCCNGCQFEKEQTVCFSGNGACDVSVCDGRSAACPAGQEASEGMICSPYDEERPEPSICRKGACDTLLCTGADLKPCTCAPGTGRDCVYCCLKEGKCRAAGFEIQVVEGRNYSLPDGTECMGGTCSNGKCIPMAGLRSLYNITVLKRPNFPFESSGSVHRRYSALIGTVLSLLVLLLLRL